MNTETTIPVGLCQCGCGKTTTIHRDKSRKFLSGHNSRKHGDFELWSQGKSRHSQGYIWIRNEDHPKSHNGYVLEHILVAEEKLGRALRDGEHVHHDNEVKSDNRPENLIVFPSKSAHHLFHQRLIALRACGNPDWRKCQFCHNYDAVENMKKTSNRCHAHAECIRVYNRTRAAKQRN